MKKLILKSSLSYTIGGLEPEIWAKKMAKELREQTKQQNTIRIDLESILKIRKIKKPIKREEKLGCIIKLVPIKNGFNLVVDKSFIGKYQRQNWRYSIAHEIGHTFFFDLEQSIPKRLPGLGFADSSEEKLCDLFAAELLMDENLVLEQFNSLSDRTILEILKILANKFDVSFSSMSLRLIGILNTWQGIILVTKWLPKEVKKAGKNTGDAWRIYWSVVPSSLQNDVYIPKPTSYRNFYPKLKWDFIDNFVSTLNENEIREISITAQELGKVGNLKQVMKKFAGEQLKYSSYVAIIDQMKNTENIYKSSKYKLIVFAIPLDEPNYHNI